MRLAIFAVGSKERDAEAASISSIRGQVCHLDTQRAPLTKIKTGRITTSWIRPASKFFDVLIFIKRRSQLSK